MARRLVSATVLGIVMATVAIMQSPLTARATPPDFSALLGTSPYVHMFSVAVDCGVAKNVNNLTGTDLDRTLSRLARWYTHIHGDAANTFVLGTSCQGASPSTLASKLAAKGVLVSNYRNGSDVSQASADAPLNFGEAADLEASAPLSIGTWWPGDWMPGTSPQDGPGARLAVGIGTAATTITVTKVGAARPAQTPATWPYVSSRGTGLNQGAYSQNTHDFVSWVRLDDEILQVVADPVVTNNQIVLTVRRGTFGTTPTSHPVGTRVMVPVYVGNSNAGIADTNLNGAPVRDNTNFPLRYGLKIWEADAQSWIAGRITNTFGPNYGGYTAVWLDVSSCQMYNYASARGDQIDPWNDPVGTKMDVPSWGNYQQQKLSGLRTLLPGVEFIGNNFRTRPNPTIDPCNEQLAQGSYDLVDLEHWLKERPDVATDWANEMPQAFDVQINNIPAIFWARWARGYTTAPAQQIQRFTYGSLLLAYRTTASAFQYGGAFGLASPPQLFFWNWGQPVGSPTSTADVQIAGTNLYRRDYANGIIVVNPSLSSATYNLGGTYYDVVNKDSSGNPSPVTSVTIASGDAAFLLRSAP